MSCSNKTSCFLRLVAAAKANEHLNIKLDESRRGAALERKRAGHLVVSSNWVTSETIFWAMSHCLLLCDFVRCACVGWGRLEGVSFCEECSSSILVVACLLILTRPSFLRPSRPLPTRTLPSPYHHPTPSPPTSSLCEPHPPTPSAGRGNRCCSSRRSRRRCPAP